MKRSKASSRSIRTILLTALGLAVLTIGGWEGWRKYATAQLKGRLPPIPKVSTLPSGFALALQTAEQHALASSTSIAGIAELGRLYQANNLLSQAEVCWKLLRQRAPHNGHWTYYLADLARTKGDDESMAAWLKETVELDPTYATAWLKLAEWEFKTGQTDQAERDYRRRLALVPGDPYARLGLARVATARNQRSDARLQIETLIKDVPLFYPANNLLSEILVESGDAAGANTQRKLGRQALRFREADDPWLDELKESCFDVTQLALWASIELNTNHGDHGIALLERAIRIAPTNPIGYTDLGHVYLQLKEPSRARDLFGQAVALPNAAADAYAGLSTAYLDLGQPKQAAAAAQQALDRSPNDANLETALGNALRADGRVDEAIAAYRRATQLAPNIAETHFNLGSTLLQQNHADEAERALTRALALKADYPPALLALGRLTLATGKLDEAGRYARTLFAANPQMPDARQLMGWWCLQSGVSAAEHGRSGEAEQVLREGLTASPELPELSARLGLLYGEEGRLTEALAMLEKYHQLAPNDPLSSLFLGQVYLHLGKTVEAGRFLSEGEALANRQGNAPVASQCEHLLKSLASGND